MHGNIDEVLSRQISCSNRVKKSKILQPCKWFKSEQSSWVMGVYKCVGAVWRLI